MRWFVYAPYLERMRLIALNLWLTHLEPLALIGLTPASSKVMQPFRSEMTSSSSRDFLGDFSYQELMSAEGAKERTTTAYTRVPSKSKSLASQLPNMETNRSIKRHDDDTENPSVP